jgi:hypothetical protein
MLLVARGRRRLVHLLPPDRLPDEGDEAFYARTRWSAELEAVLVEVVQLGRSELAALFREVRELDDAETARRVIAACVRGVTVSVETDDGVVDLASGLDPGRLAELLDGVYLDGAVTRTALGAQGITRAERDF